MVIPVQTRRPASPRARELSRKIEETIEEFEHHYPSTRPSDIRAALDLVGERSPGPAVRVGLAVGLGLALLLGLLVAYLAMSGGASLRTGGTPIAWLVVGLAILVGLIAVASALRD